jgi:hypothetical protein
MSKHQICHAHCPKPSSGGGALVLVLAAVLVLGMLGAAAHAVAPAIDSAIRTAFEILKIAGLTLAGAAVLAGAGWLVHRHREAAGWLANDAARAREHSPAVARLPERFSAARELAVAAPRAPLAIEAPSLWAHELSGLGEIPEPAPAEIRRQQS